MPEYTANKDYKKLISILLMVPICQYVKNKRLALA